MSQVKRSEAKRRARFFTSLALVQNDRISLKCRTDLVKKCAIVMTEFR